MTTTIPRLVRVETIARLSYIPGPTARRRLAAAGIAPDFVLVSPCATGDVESPLFSAARLEELRSVIAGRAITGTGEAT